MHRKKIFRGRKEKKDCTERRPFGEEERRAMLSSPKEPNEKKKRRAKLDSPKRRKRMEGKEKQKGSKGPNNLKKAKKILRISGRAVKSSRL